MAIITAPAFALKQVDWTLDRPAQINRSAYTGTRTVVANPWHGIWRAKVTLRTEQGEAAIRTLRGFFARNGAGVGTFGRPLAPVCNKGPPPPRLDAGVPGELVVLSRLPNSVSDRSMVSPEIVKTYD